MARDLALCRRKKVTLEGGSGDGQSRLNADGLLQMVDSAPQTEDTRRLEDALEDTSEWEASGDAEDLELFENAEASQERGVGGDVGRRLGKGWGSGGSRGSPRSWGGKVDANRVDSAETSELSNTMDVAAMEDADLNQAMALAARLQQRSSQNQSFAQLAQYTLEKSLTQKDKPKAKNGWCLPHQQCSWGDCCALWTSCNTCPGGHHSSNMPCWGKGNYQCHKKKEDCRGRWPEYWSQCSKSCGGGDQVKEYIVTSFPANGGAACPAGEGKTKRQPCNEQACCPAAPGWWNDKDDMCMDPSAAEATEIPRECCGK